MTEDLSATPAGLVLGEALDAAFLTGLTSCELQGLAVTPIASERLVVVLPPARRFAARKRLTLDALRDDAFAGFKRGATIRRAVDARAAETGFLPRVQFEAGEVGRVRALVAEGLAVTVLPISDATAPGPEVAVAELAGPRLLHELFLAHGAERRLPPAVATFVAHTADRTGAKR